MDRQDVREADTLARRHRGTGNTEPTNAELQELIQHSRELIEKVGKYLSRDGGSRGPAS
jgi:hypothetical protein